MKMNLFKRQENWIKCGRCGTEFYLNKNRAECPLCHFGNNNHIAQLNKPALESVSTENIAEEGISKPPDMELQSGKVFADNETKVWGSWLMFNDFFAPKFLARVLAWKMHHEKKDDVDVLSLIQESVRLIEKHNFYDLKGFPSKIKEEENLQKDPAVSRLVHHFLATATKMGFFEVVSHTSIGEHVWQYKWKDVRLTLTKEGLQFARLNNPVFDEGKRKQVLSSEEKAWLVNYLKKIDRQGYKEYSVIKEVCDFLKEGHNGKNDLWEWFENNQKFQDYIKERSKRARDDPKVFEKQLHNYARTFASTKISLLRELGIVKDERNDYTIVGEL